MDLMKVSYPHELVELGNQAWILNCALAELHRFNLVLKVAPNPHVALSEANRTYLKPAMARLQTRLDALMSKWCNRMSEMSDDAIDVGPTDWGIAVVVPKRIAAAIQHTELGTLPLEVAKQKAAQCSGDFFVAYVGKHNEGSDTVSVIQFSGVDLSCSKMWWSWHLPSEWPWCRQLVVSDNLWLVDGCGLAANDVRVSPA